MPTFGPTSISETGDNGYSQDSNWAAGIVVAGIDTTNLHAGLRWQNVTVPQGSTVSSATLRVQARNAVTGVITDVHLKVRGHLGDAPQWADGVFEPDSMTATTAGTDWDPTAWVIDDFYDIDVTAVIQEIVSGTWSSGNDLALGILNDGSTGINNIRMWQFTDGDGADITIVYSSTPGGDLAVSLAEAQVGGSNF